MSEFNDTFAMCLLFALFVIVIYMVTATIVMSLYVIIRIIVIKNKNRIIKKINKTKRGGLN